MQNWESDFHRWNFIFQWKLTTLVKIRVQWEFKHIVKIHWSVAVETRSHQDQNCSILQPINVILSLLKTSQSRTDPHQKAHFWVTPNQWQFHWSIHFSTYGINPLTPLKVHESLNSMIPKYRYKYRSRLTFSDTLCLTTLSLPYYDQ